MIEKLKSLQNYRGKFTNGSEFASYLQTDNELMNLIDTLSIKFLGKRLNGCINCHLDAFFELLTLPIEKEMEKLNCKFKLRAGVLLEDNQTFDVSKMMTNHNITDEMSIYHLKTNPHCRKFFTELPDNIDELLASEETNTDSEESQVESEETQTDSEESQVINEVKNKKK